MTLIVAFLRGINVGGHTVKQEQLYKAFSSLGLQNVVTYKQSGNVIFEADAKEIDEMKAKIEETLRNMLGYDTAVFFRTISQLKVMIALNVFEGQEREGTSFLVTMLPDAPAKFLLELPLTIPKSTAKIISVVGAEVFSVTHGDGEGALPNPFVESKLKVKATTRNMNTIKGIVKKALRR